MYHNIEKREHAVTRFPAARYRGWDASGRFWFVGKGGVRGSLWWASCRDAVETTIFGETLGEISERLAATKQ